MYLFIVIVTKGKRIDNNLSLDKKNTLRYKGFAAILIFLHHISQQIALPTPFMIFRYVGFILVGIFFFLSGFSLMKNYIEKDSYLTGFLWKRIPGIYIPYWFAALLLYIVEELINNPHVDFNFIKVLLGDTLIYTKLWFTTSIVIMYIIFYVCGYLAKKRIKVMFSLVFFAICIYISLCELAGLQSQWSASCLSFGVGIIWAAYQEKIERACKKRYTVLLFLSTIAFLTLFSVRLSLSYFGYDTGIMQTILRNVVSISFVILILLIMQKVVIESKSLIWFGRISYEFYIVHFVLIYPFLSALGRSNSFVLLLFVFSILISLIIHRFSKCICTKINEIVIR